MSESVNTDEAVMATEIRPVAMPEAWQRQRAAKRNADKAASSVAPAAAPVSPKKADRTPAIPASFSKSRRCRVAPPGAKRIPVPRKAKPVPIAVPEVSLGVVLVPVLPPPPPNGWTHRLRRSLGDGRVVAVCGVLAALGLLFRHEGISFLTRLHLWKQAAVDQAPSWSRFTSQEWYQQAREHAEDGDFRLALGAVRYALLASSPNDAELLDFKADMHQSLFQFQEAQSDYAQVVRLDPHDADARQNLVLCRRANRYRVAPEAQTSTLYGLHRVMLSQHRITEALAISQRLQSDRALQQTTWQAMLDRTGLSGKITVNDKGGLELDLTGGPLHPDLSLLKNFPLVGLNLAGTGIESIGPLAGMPLERLDLSGTLVHDLAPLRNAPLQTLSIRSTGVVEISALADCSHLRDLDVSRTRVADLSPLAKLPLATLRAADTPVADLRPLAALPLKRLDLARTRASDLAPLGSLGLEQLSLEETPVSDLKPLQGCALQELDLDGTSVSDLTPLAEMPLTSLSLARCKRLKDLNPLASCTELEHLVLPSPKTNHAVLANLPRLRFIHDGERL